MGDAIAVVNAGSSSIKFSLFAERGRDLARLYDGQVEEIYTAPRFEAFDARGERLGERRWPDGTALGHDGALSHVVAFVREHLGDHALRAVGHRVVHGGLAYTTPVCVDADVLADLERLNPLAPLHQPHNLSAIRTLLDAVPDLPQVACFDTALDGLPMGTRSGSLDPGVVLYLIDELGMDTRSVQHLLYQGSGLLGVSGI